MIMHKYHCTDLSYYGNGWVEECCTFYTEKIFPVLPNCPNCRNDEKVKYVGSVEVNPCDS